MKTQKFNNITVRRYLRNEMSKQEEAAFKKILQEDPAFAAKVALDKQLIKGAALDLNYRAPTIIRSRREAEKPVQGRPYHLKSLYVWAAFIAALVLLGGTVALLVNSNVETVSLYTRHYKPYMNRQAAAEAKYNTFVEAYENGFYKQTIQGMSNILLMEPENPTAHFYKGLALLSTGQNESAIQHLNTASTLMNFTDRGPVLWYLGLAYLKIGNEESAKSAFEDLNAFENLFKEKSKKILKEL